VQGGGANAPAIFFLPKHSLVGYRVEEGANKKWKYFQNDYLGCVKTEKIKQTNLLFLNLTFVN
jgi:hypothetical protein